MKPMTAVCLTVDLECTIAGAFANTLLTPLSDEPIWCRVDGRSHGLGFILETLARHDLVATFFLETNHAHYFQQEVFRPALKAIVDAGHDVQLHAHPCWSVFKHTDWREKCSGAGLDDFSKLSLAESTALIEEGIETFARWDLPRPVIFRSGNLQHDHNLYRALADCNVPFSSSIGLGIYDSLQPALRHYSGHHQIDNVLELPITSFEDWSPFGEPHIKSLTVAGTPFTEMKSLLAAAELAALSPVVILTHPFEFVYRGNVRYSDMRPHEINQRRFDALCGYLNANRDRFSTIRLATAAAQVDPAKTGDNVILATSAKQSIARKMGNMLETISGPRRSRKLPDNPFQVPVDS